ncbi:MAG TPA: tripartite tricarboxylate transporter substrate binding protein [Burkholderiales bacterium]|nr:tripartite tricarboxylate transporter substrate binding protein [Burkholderiales bacterium]
MKLALRIVCAALAGAPSLALCAAPSAPGYPTKPIRIIVPQSAGGSTDLAARVVTQRLSDALGQPIVVDNRPGAGSLNGTETVAKAPPDGYTLLVVAASFTINPALHERLPFDPVRDFAPVTRLAALPHILVVHPTLPVKSVKELIALAKAKPGELNYASSGIATSTHLAAELFKHMTGTDMVQVPFKGGAPGVVGLLSGQVQLYFATISTALPHVKSGKIRALAVTTAKRSVVAPEYPTIAEAGVPGYEHASWIGMLAPAKTPAPVVALLNVESAKVVHMQETRALLLRDGLEPVGDTPQEFTAVVKQEVAKWMKVVKAAGIKPN